MIFAAGLGTRLKPITDTIPKALLPIGGKTLLQHQLERLRDAGFQEIVINIHHFPEQIIRFCHEHDNFGLNILFSDETELLLETGGGLKKAKELLLPTDEPILVCNVDILSNIDIPSLVSAHKEDALATIVVSERQTQRYFLFNEKNHLCGWTNIATGEVRPASLAAEPAEKVLAYRKLAFSGMQIVSPRIFNVMASWPEKFSITNFYLDVLPSERIDAFVPQNYRMMDIGKIDHLHEAELFAESL